MTPLTMIDRELLAERAFDRDLQKLRDRYFVVAVEKSTVPENSKPVEAWETPTQWIIVGEPSKQEDPEAPDYHNCDAMGCGWSHVIARIPKPQ